MQRQKRCFHHDDSQMKRKVGQTMTCMIDMFLACVTDFFFSKVKTKTQIRCTVTVQLINAFVFATRLIQFNFSLKSKIPSI